MTLAFNVCGLPPATWHEAAPRNEAALFRSVGWVFDHQCQRDPQHHLPGLVPDADDKDALVPVGEIVPRYVREGCLGFGFGRLKAVQLQTGFVGDEGNAVVRIKEEARQLALRNFE